METLIRCARPITLKIGLLAAAVAIVSGVLYTGHARPMGGVAQRTVALSNYATTARGYIATSTTEVLFVQWIDHHGILEGSAQETVAIGTPPRERVLTRNLRIAGRIQGSQIELSLNGGPKEFGTYSERTFTIDYPSSNGQLVPVTFHQVAVSTYNSAIARLHSVIASADSVAARRERIAGEMAAIREAAATVTRDVSSLIATASDLVSQAQKLATALSTLAGAVATTRSAAEQAINGTTATRCNLAATVADYANTVADYAHTFAHSLPTFSLITAIMTLKSAFNAFRAAQAKLPKYVPVHAPSQAELTGSFSRAQRLAGSAISIADRYIDLANAYVDDAFGYAAEAYRAGNCGPAPVAPTPIPLIRS